VQDDLRLKTEFVALKEREIKVQQESIKAQEARKAELEGALVAYKGVLAATEGLLHVVREGGDLLAEQDKIIADLGAAVEKCPAPMRGRAPRQGGAPLCRQSPPPWWQPTTSCRA